MPGKRNADCSDFVPQATWVYQLEDIWVVTAMQHLNTGFWSQSVVGILCQNPTKVRKLFRDVYEIWDPRDVYDGFFRDGSLEGLLRIFFFRRDDGKRVH